MTLQGQVTGPDWVGAQQSSAGQGAGQAKGSRKGRRGPGLAATGQEKVRGQVVRAAWAEQGRGTVLQNQGPPPFQAQLASSHCRKLGAGVEAGPGMVGQRSHQAWPMGVEGEWGGASATAIPAMTYTPRPEDISFFYTIHKIRQPITHNTQSGINPDVHK